MFRELEAYRLEFAAIERDAGRLLAGLTEQEIAWRENPAAWSMADCLNHLVVTGRQSLANIHRVVADARARGDNKEARKRISTWRPAVGG